MSFSTPASHFLPVALGEAPSFVLPFFRKLFPHKQFYWFQRFVGWALKAPDEKVYLEGEWRGENAAPVETREGNGVVVFKWPIEVGA